MKKKIKQFCLLSIIATVLLYLANKAIFFLALAKEMLSVGNGTYYEWKFGKVFYKKKGSGSPLLLIHDLQADASGYEWSSIEKELTKKHTVYTVDLPGCGRSDKPKLTYTGFLYVQFLLQFIKDVIQEPVAVAATGASSSFVLLAASQNEALFTKLMLINPPSEDDQQSQNSWQAKLFKNMLFVPVFGTCIYSCAASLRSIYDKFHNQYFYDKRECLAKHINTYYESAHLGGYSARFLYASIAVGYTNLPVFHVLNRLTLPITVVGGAEKSNCFSVLREYKSRNPKIVVHRIPATKQLPQLEEPQKVLALFD